MEIDETPSLQKCLSVGEQKQTMWKLCHFYSCLTSTFVWLHPNLRKEWFKWDYNTPSYALLRKSYLSKWQKSTREQEELSCSASGNSTQCVHSSLHDMMVHFPQMPYKWEILRTLCNSVSIVHIYNGAFQRGERWNFRMFLINVFTGPVFC